MKFLLLNTDYPDFLDWLYGSNPGLEQEPYAAQMKARNESLFGTADFYSRNLRALGHEAWDIHVNNEDMQRAWAREHAKVPHEPPAIAKASRHWLQRTRQWAVRTPLRHLKPLFRSKLRSLGAPPSWFYGILGEQIRHYRPDVVLNHDPGGISHQFLKEMRSCFRLLVAQIASPIPSHVDFGGYDLVLSSLPNFVNHFRDMGARAGLLRFAFEPPVLDHLAESAEKLDVSFVGSLSLAHVDRIELLERLCGNTDAHVWGPGVEELPVDSFVRKRYHGPAWGREMYQILFSSRMTLNHHIGIAGPYANNMRLFEATGVETLLVTDWKDNLADMFEPGKEVITYRSTDECIEAVRFYLDHEEERKCIARAGQQRTLGDHTYQQRMGELVDIVTNCL